MHINSTDLSKFEPFHVLDYFDLEVDGNENYIKVNIPDNEENFASGNGEGCWAIVNRDVKERCRRAR